MRSGFPSPGTRWAHTLRQPALFLSALLVLSAVALADAATLTGHVTDPDGRAVPNARVIVSGRLGPVAETRTGTTGEYEVADLPDGRYDVRILAPGFNAPAAALTLAADEHRTRTAVADVDRPQAPRRDCTAQTARSRGRTARSRAAMRGRWKSINSVSLKS